MEEDETVAEPGTVLSLLRNSSFTYDILYFNVLRSYGEATTAAPHTCCERRDR